MKHKIDALTGLRFFAAFAIFAWHLRGYFVPNNFFDPFYPAGAVPLFFVLSGFVLSFGGMRDRSWADFFVARFARIWPVHIATLVLLFVQFWPWSKVYFYSNQALVSLSLNALLLHDWFPTIEVYGGYNGVSWSISAEMFFYAVFPLVFAIALKAPLRLLAVATIAVTGWIFAVSILFPGVDKTWLGSMNPISGLWSFVIGAVCGAWLGSIEKRTAQIKPVVWTAIELGAVVLVLAANGRFVTPDLSFLPLPLEGFIVEAGPAPAYATLIVVLALSRGCIARFLSTRPLVYTGEVSFAFYLVHQLVIRWYANHIDLFSNHGSVRLALVTGVSVGIAMLFHHAVEVPARGAIVAAWKKRRLIGAAATNEAVRHHSA